MTGGTCQGGMENKKHTIGARILLPGLLCLSRLDW